ncbi:MAG: glycosyltransferase family 4 protein [Anaerolineae bacterium]|nr:glycosyltransferase family 4 protein [Anaerolineae bacterium]
MARWLAVAPAIKSFTSPSLFEQDLLLSLQHLRRAGHDAYLLTSLAPYQAASAVRSFYESVGIPATLVPEEKQRSGTHQPRNQMQSDAYGLPSESVAHFLRDLELLMNDWPPDAVWCHGSRPWMVSERAHRRRIPTVVRSVGDTTDRSLNRRVAGVATVFAAASPTERRSYAGMPKSAHLLPLLSLAQQLRPSRPPFPARPLRVAYILPDTGADALKILYDIIAPGVRLAAPNGFVFHVAADPLPALVQSAPDIILDPKIPNVESFLADSDIAIVPPTTQPMAVTEALSILCQTIPTITQRNILGGFPYIDGVNVMIANSDDDYAQKLLALRDPLLRARVSMGAASQSTRLFNEDQLAEHTDSIISAVLR